eukprot:7382026-Prymnesium_polylepis.1
MLRYGVPPKLVELLIALHASVLVKFEIDGVLKTLLSIIGVKQGDLLGQNLFNFFICAIMKTWRLEPSYALCLLCSREDFTLTGRPPATHGVEFAVSDS